MGGASGINLCCDAICFRAHFGFFIGSDRPQANFTGLAFGDGVLLSGHGLCANHLAVICSAHYWGDHIRHAANCLGLYGRYFKALGKSSAVWPAGRGVWYGLRTGPGFGRFLR